MFNASIIMTMMAMMTTMTTMMMMTMMMMMVSNRDLPNTGWLGQVCKKMLEGVKPIKGDKRDLQFQFKHIWDDNDDDKDDNDDDDNDNDDDDDDDDDDNDDYKGANQRRKGRGNSIQTIFEKTMMMTITKMRMSWMIMVMMVPMMMTRERNLSMIWRGWGFCDIKGHKIDFKFQFRKYFTEL